MLLCIIGRSASGKDTIVNEIVKNIPELHICISHTTRKPRHYEVDGKDYYFITESKFNDMVSNNEFVETRSYKSADGTIWYYGLSKNEISNNFKNSIVIIDLKGYKQLLESNIKDKIFSVYIKTDDKIRRLRYLKRLDSNPSESELAELERRIQQDKIDMPFFEVAPTVDLIVCNNTENDFYKCVNTLSNLIKFNELDELDESKNKEHKQVFSKGRLKDE